MQQNYNEHKETVDGFGDEWSRFDQSGAADTELEHTFQEYFAIFPWEAISRGARGIDVGCGSGRWARLVAPRVGKLDCVDASDKALVVAARNLHAYANVSLTRASAGLLPFGRDTFDFGYSLGVLHHLPDTQAALNECIRVLKPGAPFLIYLYYALDNRPRWYRALWKASDAMRQIISRLPRNMRHLAADVVATTIYWPLARAARIGEQLGIDVAAIPLSAYREHSLYIMRNDALDRFGTRLEQRFTRLDVERLMRNSGLVNIQFSEHVPFWCAIGFKVN